MKLITVKTSKEAYHMANELSNVYESDKKFNGIIIKVGE